MTLMWLAACSSIGEAPETRELAAHADAVVAAAATLTRVSCERQPKAPTGPDRTGCLYQGSPDQIRALLDHYGAQPGFPGPHVSLSPCVRHNEAIGRQLPGSDDWFPKDGAQTYQLASALPPHATRKVTAGDVHTVGDHVCVEFLEPAR